MPSIIMHDESTPSVYSFGTEKIASTEVEYNRSKHRVQGGENVEEMHTLLLNDGTKVLLMTIEDDEAEQGAEKYIYCLQVYSQEELKNESDPHASMWISKGESMVLKELCRA